MKNWLCNLETVNGVENNKEKLHSISGVVFLMKGEKEYRISAPP